MQVIFQLLAWISRLLSRLIVFLTVNNKWAVSTCLQHSTWFINSTKSNIYLKLLKIISASESLFWSTCFVSVFVVCKCRNVNTIMWRCLHKLACFTLQQIRGKMNTVNKNTPCSTLRISKLYTRLRFRKASHAFLGCLIA